MTVVNQRRHVLPKNDILSFNILLLMRMWYMHMRPSFRKFLRKAETWKQILKQEKDQTKNKFAFEFTFN